MADLTLTMDVKTVIAVGALIASLAVGWTTLKMDTNELQRKATAAAAESAVAHERLDAVQRQLVELTITLRLKGVTP